VSASVLPAAGNLGFQLSRQEGRQNARLHTTIERICFPILIMRRGFTPAKGCSAEDTTSWRYRVTRSESGDENATWHGYCKVPSLKVFATADFRTQWQVGDARGLVRPANERATITFLRGFESYSAKSDVLKGHPFESFERRHFSKGSPVLGFRSNHVPLVQSSDPVARAQASF
jgi:hypothetical protein